jgi:hypothetical protein
MSMWKTTHCTSNVRVCMPESHLVRRCPFVLLCLCLAVASLPPSLIESRWKKPCYGLMSNYPQLCASILIFSLWEAILWHLSSGIPSTLSMRMKISMNSKYVVMKFPPDGRLILPLCVVDGFAWGLRQRHTAALPQTSRPWRLYLTCASPFLQGMLVYNPFQLT